LQARGGIEQLAIDAVGEEAQEAVGLRRTGVEVDRTGGQPARPHLHVVLASKARERVTR
jgi:hypothetical protein